MALRSLPAGLASNRPERHWLKTVVVSIGGKRQVHVACQVRIEKTSTSEPLFRRRNREGDIKTWGRVYPRDKPIGEPAYWVGGVRRKDGVSSIQARQWNCGNSAYV